MPKINFCSFLSKKKKHNPMVKVLIEILSKMFVTSVKCPFVGLLELREFSLTDKNLFMMPQGIIRFTVHGTTNFDELLVYISLLFEIEN